MKLNLLLCAVVSAISFQLCAEGFVSRTAKYPFRVTRDVAQDTGEVFTGRTTKRVAYND